MFTFNIITEMFEFNSTDLLPIFICPKYSRLLFDSFYSFFWVKYYYNILDFFFYYLLSETFYFHYRENQR